MTRENVIRDLDLQIAWIRDNDFHKFPGWGHAVLAMRDALELLKAQEPMNVKFRLHYAQREHGRRDGYCPKCGAMIESIYNIKYCGVCGQAVKWE